MSIRASRRSAPAETDQQLETAISGDGDILVVAFAGSIVGRTVGLLLDTLVDLVVSGNRKLILDVSGVTAASRAGLRGIVVTARMLQVRGGRMRICGASGDTLAALRALSLQHLIHIDADQATARHQLSPPASGIAALPVSDAVAETGAVLPFTALSCTAAHATGDEEVA